MSPHWKQLSLIGAIWSAVATAVNILGVWLMNPTSISFGLALSAILFFFAGHIFWLVAAAMYASQSGLKIWPLWFFLLHPMISVIVFWLVNRKQIMLQNQQPIINPGKDSAESIVSPMVYVIVSDILLIIVLPYLVIIGYGVVPVFAALYEGMGSQLPLITRISLHPFSAKVLPVLFLIFAIILNLRLSIFDKCLKSGLLAITMSSLFFFIISITAIWLPFYGIK